jgi:hypothetical protein
MADLRCRRNNTARQAFRSPWAELKTPSTPPNLPEQAIDDSLEGFCLRSSPNAPTISHTLDMLEAEIGSCQGPTAPRRIGVGTLRRASQAEYSLLILLFEDLSR